MAPSFTYRINCENAKPQAISSADRPLCAVVSALASAQPFGGSARMFDAAEARAMLLRYLADEHQVGEMRLDAWLRSLRHEDRDHPYPRTVGPHTLDPYQLETIERLPLCGGVMALGCGLGKTVTAIAAAQRVACSIATARNRLWIVCPLNAMSTWERMRPHLRLWSEVIILSMDSLHKIADATTNRGGVLIFDEAHNFGERNARRTKAAHTLRPKFDAAFCLTGTLLHGGIEKALSIQDLAIPGLARFASRWSAGEYFRCLVKVRVGNRTLTDLKLPTGLAREAFMEYLAWGSVNMTKDSAIVKQTMELPAQHIHTLELGDCDQPLDEIAAAAALKILGETGELPHAQAVAHALCREGAAEKIAWFMGELDDPTQQVVAFAHYHETLDALCAALEAAKIPFVRIDGSTGAAARQEAESLFQQGKVRVFVGQMVAASVSMNLQNANISVTFDHDWKAYNYEQSLARTCRRGQTQDCHHFDLVTNRLQRTVVQRLRTAMDFNAEAADWQDLKVGIARSSPGA